MQLKSRLVLLQEVQSARLESASILPVNFSTFESGVLERTGSAVKFAWMQLNVHSRPVQSGPLWE
jgi:hypothetical protein